MSGPMPGPGVERLIAKARQHVADTGVSLTYVGGSPTEPPFAYTAGLTESGLAELWCSALGGPAKTGQVLNEAAAAAFAGRVDLVPGPLDLGWTVTFKLRAVRVDAACISMARALYPTATLRVLQLMWPDTAGRFPDDVAYDQVGFCQELLPPSWLE